MSDNPQKTTDEELIALVKRVFDLRRPLLFSRRKMFDDALRPYAESGGRIAYPDALYHITKKDVDRAEDIVNAEIK